MKNSDYKIEKRVVIVTIVFLVIFAMLLIVPLSFWQSEKARVKAEVLHNYFEPSDPVAPTCTAAGYTPYECINDRCNHVKKTNFVLPLGHDIVATAVAPTCTSEGYTLRKCRREKCNFEEQVNVTQPTGHSLSAPVVVAPTCTEEGYTSEKCTNEGCTFEKKTETVNALGHDYNASTHFCSRCDQLDPSAPVTSGLGYTAVYDEEDDSEIVGYIVTGLGTAQINKYVKIEGTHEGKSVIGIGAEVFQNKTGIAVVVLPDSIKTIGADAFKGCTALKLINLPSGLEEIGAGAFSGCSAYEPTVIPSGVKLIGFGAFEGCAAIEEMMLPYAAGKEVPDGENTKIEYLHFGYIFGAETYEQNGVKVPASLKTVKIVGNLAIVENAFYGCASLTEVSVSDAVPVIGFGAFDGCTAIETMTLSYKAIKEASEEAEPDDGEDETEEEEVEIEYLHFGYIFGAVSYEQNGSKVPATLNKLTLSGNVAIADNAFNGCTALESVVLSEVVAIGEYAFTNCSALKEITIPNSVKTIGDYAFFGCTALEQIKLPTALEKIGDGAFGGCILITELVVPDSVKLIGLGAFDGCPIETLSLPYAAGKEVTEDEVTTIEYLHAGYIFGAETYEQNAAKVPATLKTVTVTGNLAIADNAFNGCTSIEKVTITANVSKIGDSAFEGCTALANITLASGLKEIGENAFKGCTAIKTVVIPVTVSDIGLGAFEGCSAIEKMSLPYAVGKNGTKYSHFGYAFGAETYSQNAAKVPTSLKTVIVTGSLDIVDNAFNGCTSIEKIGTEKGVKKVGASAFKGCTSLKVVALATGLTEIGANAFDGCAALNTVTLGKGIKSIGESAFKGCAAIKTVFYNGSIADFGVTEYKDKDSSPLVSTPDFYVYEDFVQYR